MTTPRIMRKSRVRRFAENALLAAGVMALGAWLWSIAGLAVFQNWEDWVFEREIRGQPATLADFVAEKRKSIAEEVRIWFGITGTPKEFNPHLPIGPPMATPPLIGKDGLVGRLTIPRLHLSAMVREGADEQTLRLTLGHIPGTALPGQFGNVGVAGHRDTLFRSLRNIEPNELILFETFNGNYSYEVEGTEIVSPRQVSVLNAGRHPELTLVTCYPFDFIGSAPNRFIVKARLLSVDQTEQQENNPVKFISEPSRPARATSGEDTGGIRRVSFEVRTHHSRRLSDGILFGVTMTDVPRRRVNGWIWVTADRRTVWLRNQRVYEPVIFSHMEGKCPELMITAVSKHSVKGYLTLPDRRLAQGVRTSGRSG